MRISALNRPVACISMGYPAGIGPEVIVKALASRKIRRLANFLIAGDISVFKKAEALCRKRLRYGVAGSVKDIDFARNKIVFFDLDSLRQEGFRFGVVGASYGRASIDYIRKAVALIKAGKADCLITAPIHKHAAELSGFKFPGHTEYLAHLTGTKEYAMMFAGGPFRLVLATTHLPIRDVAKRLKAPDIIKILRLTDFSLKRYFGIRRPRIAVCGLNPHAGEGGLLGDEDIKVILPAIRYARNKGIDAYGPLAADSVFYDMYKPAASKRTPARHRYDCVLCMYHDQGLVALKMIARDESVNITLGLPFIRTSPAHGTALDIAGRNMASADSMKKAIGLAVSMLHNRR